MLRIIRLPAGKQTVAQMHGMQSHACAQHDPHKIASQRLLFWIGEDPSERATLCGAEEQAGSSDIQRQCDHRAEA